MHHQTPGSNTKASSGSSPEGRYGREIRVSSACSRTYPQAPGTVPAGVALNARQLRTGAASRSTLPIDTPIPSFIEFISCHDMYIIREQADRSQPAASNDL